jgi:hypothetical protein
MRKLLGVICVASLCLGPAQAQNGTSTSPQGAAGIYTGSAVCASSSSGLTPSISTCTDNSNNGLWFTVMNASVKTSTTTDLFISPSLVTGLYTETQVKGSSAGTSQTAAATGSVAVRVIIDCTNCAPAGKAQSGLASFAAAAQPDPKGTGIVFDARIQQLTATLGQVVTSACLTTNTCTDEQINLVLDTTSAHTFNFILLNVGSGTHTITVQARLDAGQVCTTNNSNGTGGVTCATVNTNLGSSVAAALFGVGSVIVQPVHLGPSFQF